MGGRHERPHRQRDQGHGVTTVSIVLSVEELFTQLLTELVKVLILFTIALELMSAIYA